jgi:hypothetical protein
MFIPAKVLKSFKPGEPGRAKGEDGKVSRPSVDCSYATH